MIEAAARNQWIDRETRDDGIPDLHPPRRSQHYT